MAVAVIVLTLAATYLALGVCFALLFVTRQVTRLDPAAAGTSWGFRLMIFPGATAFWPWLLRRWLAHRGTPP